MQLTFGSGEVFAEMITDAYGNRNHFGEHFAATKRQLHDIPFNKKAVFQTASVTKIITGTKAKA